MKGRKLAITLMVFAAVGIFGFVPYLRAQTNQKMMENRHSMMEGAKHQKMMEGKHLIMEGAKQMMHGTHKIMTTMEKKGLVNEKMRAADKQMKEGYGMVMKGNDMMSGSSMAKGQEMMKHGAAMMLEAHTAMEAAGKMEGITEVCAIDLHECHKATQKIEHGATMWYLGALGY